jgi:hypothetical protein
VPVSALNRATLARQLLLAREPLRATEAVARLAGLQAQASKAPFLGLATRLDGFTHDELRAAIHRGEVVRATMMRGTLHLVTRDDYRAWRPLLQPALSKSAGTIARNGPTMDLDALLDAARALYAESPRTFEELRTELVARFPKWNERLMGYAVRMHLPLVMVPDDSPSCFPPEAKFTLAETGAGSLHDFVLRYLAAFGPATPADFQTWSGLAGARVLFDDLRPRLHTFRDTGKRELFDLPDAPRPDPATPAPPRLLPEFDNLLLAHADRTRIIADEHRPRVVTKNLRVLPTFLVDGVVAGTWSFEKKQLALAPFGKLSRAVRDALHEDAARLLQ